MLIFMFFSSFFAYFRPPKRRKHTFRDKGTTFFAHTQEGARIFMKKVEILLKSLLYSLINCQDMPIEDTLDERNIHNNEE